MRNAALEDAFDRALSSLGKAASGDCGETEPSPNKASNTNAGALHSLSFALSELFRKSQTDYVGKPSSGSLANALTIALVNSNALESVPIESGHLVLALIQTMAGTDPDYQIRLVAKRRGNLSAAKHSPRKGMALGNYLDNWQEPKGASSENSSGHLARIASELRVSDKFAYEALQRWRTYKEHFPNKIEVGSGDQFARLNRLDPQLAAFALFQSKPVDYDELCIEWRNSGK